jgi:hypothetical protein
MASKYTRRLAVEIVGRPVHERRHRQRAVNQWTIEKFNIPFYIDDNRRNRLYGTGFRETIFEFLENFHFVKCRNGPKAAGVKYFPNVQPA